MQSPSPQPSGTLNQRSPLSPISDISLKCSALSFDDEGDEEGLKTTTTGKAGVVTRRSNSDGTPKKSFSMLGQQIDNKENTCARNASPMSTSRKSAKRKASSSNSILSLSSETVLRKQCASGLTLIPEEPKSPVLPQKHHRPSPSQLNGSSDASTGLERSLREGLWEPSHHVCRLPLCNSKSDLNSIQPSVLAELLSGESRHAAHYDELHIIDCRFGYEFEGGHIKGAINMATSQEVQKRFAVPPPEGRGERIVIIFHCEFSSKRGPRLYKCLRAWDRKAHEQSYPELYYPEVYLLEGGYKKFYEQFPELCEPRSYVPMRDRRFMAEMCRCMRELGKKKKKELVRSRSLSVEDSDVRAFEFGSPSRYDPEAADSADILSISPKRGWSGNLRRSAGSAIFPSREAKEAIAPRKSNSWLVPRRKAKTVDSLLLRDDPFNSIPSQEDGNDGSEDDCFSMD